MKVKSTLPYFGGKRTLAPQIVQTIGKHTQYFEPFCGSLAVLFAKDPSQKETVNDLHGDATNLARVIQNEELAKRLYAEADRMILGDGILEDGVLYLQSNELDPDETDYQRAFWFFAVSWMSRNGLAGTDRQDFQLAVRFTKGGGSTTVRFRSVVDSIPDWHRRLQNVVILQRDAFEMIPKFEDCEATAIYCDPPYLPESRTGWESSGANSRYLHEFDNTSLPMFGEVDDHERLASMLNEFEHAKIVVSYYDCKRVRELYAGWHFQEIETKKQLSRAKGNTIGEATELIISNRSPSNEL